MSTAIDGEYPFFIEECFLRTAQEIQTSVFEYTSIQVQEITRKILPTYFLTYKLHVVLLEKLTFP